MKAVAHAAEWLRAQKSVRLVSHFDADGLCGCAIMKAALSAVGIETELEVLPVLTRAALARLPRDEPLLFIDVGSALPELDAYNAFVIDHHKSDAMPEQMLNPWSEGLDGGRDACSATLCLRVAQEFGEQDALLPIAIIGLLADSQEKRGLRGVNKAVVDTAVEKGLVSVEERLRLFGYERKGLASMLVQSRDLRIPGVTGNPHGARRMLEELGIPLRSGGRETRYNDLSAEQKAALLAMGRRRATRHPATTIHITILHEEGLFRDARQVATLLNACGRLEHAELGVAMLLGDAEARQAGKTLLNEYRDTLREAYAWLQTSKDVERGERFVIANARDKVRPSIIGTVCSMATRSGDVGRDVVVVGLARVGGLTKVSLRVNDHSERDVHTLLQSILEGFDAECGGHRVAAGAVIKTEDEARFIERAKALLSK
ncbi:DHH family phosphoesterase [Candidatus Woesearchaeota archaeon]|nr:MAG: DHH family phosphoesterase [Candidatus Woesearchaeota archaeon]